MLIDLFPLSKMFLGRGWLVCGLTPLTYACSTDEIE